LEGKGEKTVTRIRGKIIFPSTSELIRQYHYPGTPAGEKLVSGRKENTSKGGGRTRTKGALSTPELKKIATGRCKKKVKGKKHGGGVLSTSWDKR